MFELLRSLGVGGVVATVVMVVSLIGMVKCTKKQYTSPIARPLAVVFMLVLLACAVVILMKTGILGDQSAGFVANEAAYAKSGYFMLGKQLAEKAAGAKTLILTPKINPEDTWNSALIQAFKDGAAGKLSLVATATPTDRQPDAQMPMMDRFKAKDFNDVIKNYPDCNLIVFIGIFPTDVEDLNVWALPPDKQPKLGLINCFSYALKPALQSGVVIAVVSPNPAVKFDGKPAPKDKKAAFDCRYVMITPENVVKMATTYTNMFEPEKPKKK